ncbi:MAG: DNA mismatch endonuclease Vsr [Solirubrobacterales bacterium]|nr:DNA mismatch endonuclease Vsr [Solirubrobacterales bacterium]
MPEKAGQFHPDRLVKPDVVFTRQKVAVFVDGCFWHGCPEHGTTPKANSDYWKPKLERNMARDREVDFGLTAAGWTVVRVWEHDDPTTVAAKVRSVVTKQSKAS